MKKKILAVLCLISIIILSACNKNSDVENNTKINQDSSISSQSSNPALNNTSDQRIPSYKENNSVLSTPVAVNSDIDEYEIIRDEYSEGKDIVFGYPQIKGLKDTNRQKIINEILKQGAMSYFKNTSYLEDRSYLKTLDVSYQIKWKGNNLLSVQYYGWEDYSNSPHPNNLDFTTNINMKTGKIINLKDVFYIDGLMVENIIRNSNYVAPLDPDDADLMEEVRNNMIDYLTEYSITNNRFYFTKDSLCVSIDVHHGIGDHADMATKYTDLIKSINTENEIWNDFKEIRDKAIANTTENRQSQSSDKGTLSDLHKFTQFEDQSFNVNLKNWGSVRFVSGLDFEKKLKFYLTDDTGNILYRFPEYYNNYWSNQTVSAVAFRDINKDGFKDIIIISSIDTKLTYFDIYFQKGQRYVQVPTLYDDINSSNEEYDTIDKIMEYMRTRGNNIVAQALYDSFERGEISY